MKKFLVMLAVLAMFLVGCATSTVTVRDNTFVSEGSPNIRVKITETLFSQAVISTSALQKGGDFAGIIKHTIYPFAPSDRPVKCVLFIMFSDMTEPNSFWRHAGDGKDKDVDGLTWRVWKGPVPSSLMNEVGRRMDYNAQGPWYAVWFKRVVNPQRVMMIVYAEPGSPTDTTAFEERARKAFHIER